jgi:HAE1 family hydrophobic/amphiphilic exporter-1
LFDSALAGGRSIDLEITGPDLPTLVGLGGQILFQATQVLPGAQARPVPGLDLNNPELHVRRKSRQAKDMEMSNVELGYAINALVDGAYVTDYFDQGNKIDLVIFADGDRDVQLQDLASQYVATPNVSEPVRLDALADIKPGFGPEQIARRERQRAITIQITPPESMALEAAIQKLNEAIIRPMEASGQLGTMYQLNLSGTADKLRETWIALRGNFLLAILITYLLLAALFESWTNPFVIILSVPLGAVGGLLGLKLLGYYLVLQGSVPQKLDVLTMLGFVILVGTVVNNPILLVHQALTLIREHQYALVPAVLESVRSRIRPIFMTTITTVFGLAPLVLFPGAGSELYRGLGSVLLGGLMVSTIFTLVLVPSLFSLMYQLFAWLQGKPVQITVPAGKQSAPHSSTRPHVLEPMEIG